MKYKILVLYSLFTHLAVAQPTLPESEAIALARQRHPALAAASLRVRQQEALRGTARTLEPTQFFHNVTADPEYGLFGTTTVGVAQTFAARRHTAARRDLQERRVRYAVAERDLTEQQLVRQVREIYRHLGYLDGKAGLYQRLDSLYQRLAAVAEARHRGGEASLAEQLAVEDRAGQVRLALETVGHELAFDRLVLGQLLGLDSAVQAQATQLEASTFSLADTARLAASARSRVQVGAVDVARAERAAVLASRTPTVSAGVYGQYVPTGAVYPGWQVALHVPLDRSSQRGAVTASEAGIAAAEADYRRALLEQHTELSHLLHEQEKYTIELDYYERRGRALAAELLRTAELNYRAGEMDYVELAQHLEQALRIELNRLDNLYGLNLTVLELQALLGL